MRYLEKLKKYNQMHVLKYENELNADERALLHNQIERLDFSCLEDLQLKRGDKDTIITPLKAMTVDEIDEQKDKFFSLGITCLHHQKVGAVLLAGGMGTRLGSSNPKGMYNIGKTRDVYIFQRIIENLLDVVKECNTKIPLFIMTSERNNEETIQFLLEHNYFGYDRSYIRFFTQDMAVCTDLDGKILLEDKSRLATSPNGNGGWFNSLINDKNALDMLKTYGLEYLNVFAVDNVLQRVVDPVFLGAVLEGDYQIGAKVIKKANPYEKVGLMCKKNGHPSIIEYTDMTEEMALKKDDKGEYVYNYGSIMNYLFRVDFLFNTKNKKLPIHVVTKKVEYIDNNGNLIKPDTPNAHKFELLTVDMVELADSCLPFEVVREREFAPIKNKTGIDSVEAAQDLLELNGYVL